MHIEYSLSNDGQHMTSRILELGALDDGSFAVMDSTPFGVLQLTVNAPSQPAMVAADLELVAEEQAATEGARAAEVEQERVVEAGSEASETAAIAGATESEPEAVDGAQDQDAATEAADDAAAEDRDEASATEERVAPVKSSRKR